MEEIQGVEKEKETLADPTVEKPEASSAPDVKEGEEPRAVPYTEFKKRMEEVGSSKDAKYERLKSQLDTYGMSLDENGVVVPNYNAPTQPTQPAQIDELWDTDQRKAMETTMASGFEWYDKMNRQINSEKNTLRRDPSAGKQFGELEGEVDNYLNKVPIQDRGKPGVVKVAFNMVRGAHIDEYIKKAKEDVSQSALDKESLQTPSGSVKLGGKTVQLTKDELTIAAKGGITPEDYARNKEKRAIG